MQPRSLNWRAAAKLNPSAHEPHYTLGILYMQDGRFDDAARELSQAMKLHPDNAEGWATLGSLYLKMSKLPEAADALREAIHQSRISPILTLYWRQSWPSRATPPTRPPSARKARNWSEWP